MPPCQVRKLAHGYVPVRVELDGPEVAGMDLAPKADAKLTVYFDRVGSKKFIAKFAKLTRV